MAQWGPRGSKKVGGQSGCKLAGGEIRNGVRSTEFFGGRVGEHKGGAE